MTGKHLTQDDIRKKLEYFQAKEGISIRSRFDTVTRGTYVKLISCPECGADLRIYCFQPDGRCHQCGNLWYWDEEGIIFTGRTREEKERDAFAFRFNPEDRVDLKPYKKRFQALLDDIWSDFQKTFEVEAEKFNAQAKGRRPKYDKLWSEHKICSFEWFDNTRDVLPGDIELWAYLDADPRVQLIKWMISEYEERLKEYRRLD